MNDSTTPEPAEKPKCETCIFLEQGDIDPNNITNRQYFCKRMPPQVIVVPGPPGPNGLTVQISSVYPMTAPASWCGEWDDGAEDEQEEIVDIDD